jgi:hypothetical protein
MMPDRRRKSRSVEKLAWMAAQYIRVANHLPTGCKAGGISAREWAV